MEKSYVTMEQKMCVVCGQPYSTDSIFLDRKLGKRFEQYTITGWGMCEEHQKLKDDGYVALIGCDEEKSSRTPNGNIDPDGAFRTGEIAHLKTTAWENIMNVSVPDQMICFCESEVINALEKMKTQSEEI